MHVVIENNGQNTTLCRDRFENFAKQSCGHLAGDTARVVRVQLRTRLVIRDPDAETIRPRGAAACDVEVLRPRSVRHFGHIGVVQQIENTRVSINSNNGQIPF